ncbi:hypothetical protein GCM10007276_12460 [Agaricicola taiwanensis]|uniref:Uncharacterized protein n=1 Tax=Agaricicola taiwanensis TaxID=591372 RepID=A0A8J2YEE2_9RHOB|nr:hypothetical protein [Agaricicola taiwanensis]GGE36474.1 hypothetical protein GCM10007276_12460 [Agaricicola taiwanensis]
MMNNPIFLGASVLIFAYVVLSLLIPPDLFRAMMASPMAIFAAAAAVLWSEGAFRVVKEGKIDPARRAVLGLFLIAAGATFASFYSLVFNMAGRPPLWTQYQVWPIHQALQACGFYLVCSSPQDALSALPRRRFWFTVLAGVMLFLAGYVVASAAPDVPPLPDLSGYWR